MKLTAILFFLTFTKKLHNLFVRLGDAGAAESAKLDASLLRSSEHRVVAVADEKRRGGVPVSFRTICLR